jgi:hypothetical protein
MTPQFLFIYARDAMLEQLIDAREKIKNQAERIRVLEGATNHACGTPLTRALRERDEARKHLKEIEEYGTEEINAAVDLRQKLASALVERDDLQKAVNGLCDHFGVRPANTTLLAVEVLRIQREREEAITRRMETIMQCELYEQERDEAREALEYIANAGLSARHIEDYAKDFLSKK